MTTPTLDEMIDLQHKRVQWLEDRHDAFVTLGLTRYIDLVPLERAILANLEAQRDGGFGDGK